MKKRPDYDVIIIGAGASGGIIGRELSDAGLSVCVLERGPMFETKDVSMDELRFPIRQDLMWATPKVGGMTWRPHSRTATQKVFPRITQGLDGWGPGGSMTHWGGVSWRFEPSVFKALDVWGQIPGGAIANWPISYEDLEPYYTKFEYRIGVSGDDKMKFGPPRSAPYPLPPFEQGFATNHFAQACRSLGYEPFPMPAGILSRDYQGRKRTGSCGFCQSFECTVEAKSNTRVTELREALKNPNFTLLVDRYVIRMTMNRRDRIEGVVCLDSAGNEHEITASIVILAANTFYNVWLLLLSGNPYAPSGIGNQHAQVGKYFHQHPRFGINGLFDELMNVHIGPSEPVMAISDFTEDHFDHMGLGFIMGGYIYGAKVTGNAGQPIEFAKTVELPDGVPRFGPLYKDFMARTYSHYYQVHAMLTDPPMLTSFIDLDPHAKNHYGLPLPRLTFDWSPQLNNMQQFFYPKMVEILQAGGAKKIWGGQHVQPPWEMTHPSGGTRMGENPKESVTDRYGKVHGIRNLFISGNSLFPTMSAFNVTETIGALAYWQADYIKQEVLKGELV
ncbi:GMC family oxidoreductase [Paenibacillus sp. LHD-117]|uniref:GMC family oxidoreductase n=1 Tax=Paenibacillus sp. LHD-117 TaxID=3071412 RepID=UPI0027E1D1AC|nr:GMC family oxidoreductase [Paenibacillus sp. LHD-117]MDQ6417884.1 GMC family oxidoreductase [Paenibacillus sp. LHD-117]